MESKVRRTLLSYILVACIVVVGIVLGREVLFQSGKDNSVESSKKTDITLDRNLTNKSNLGDYNLSNSTRSQYNSIVKDISSQHFYGAYVGIDEKKILFSGSNGYANAGAKLGFRLDSAFSVGDYEDIVKDAIILRLADRGKVNLSDKLTKYMGNVSGMGGATVKDLLITRKNIYASSKQLKKIEANDYRNKNDVNVSSAKSSHMKKINTYLKSMLISSVLNSRYSVAISNEFATSLSLNNTRIFTNIKGAPANDVKGYRYAVSGGLPVQSEQSELQRGSMQMSMADVLLSLNKIINNDYFSKKYNHYFKEAVKANDEVELTGTSFMLQTNSVNESMIVWYKVKDNKALVIAENFPNRRLKIEDVSTRLKALLK